MTEHELTGYEKFMISLGYMLCIRGIPKDSGYHIGSALFSEMCTRLEEKFTNHTNSESLDLLKKIIHFKVGDTVEDIMKELKNEGFDIKLLNKVEFES